MNDQFTIEFSEIGITLTEKLYPLFKFLAWAKGKSGQHISTINWSEVEQVFVYKRDAFTIDVICMVFVSANGKVVEINEHMNGWEHQIEDLQNYLPGCKSFAEWFMTVAFPPFETNMTEIYRRSK